MDMEAIQTYCRSLPGTTEDMKWGQHLVFSVGKKMYAIIGLDDEPHPRFSIKTSQEAMPLLTQKPDIIPAPYLARLHWVTLTHFKAVEPEELQALIKEGYQISFQKLSKKQQRLILDEAENT